MQPSNRKKQKNYDSVRKKVIPLTIFLMGLFSIFLSFLVNSDIGFAGWMAIIGIVVLRLLAGNEK